MPMGDRYWRNHNSFLEKFTTEYEGEGVKEIRGTVNELSFMVFCKLAEEDVDANLEKATEAARLLANEAIRYTLRFTQRTGGEHAPILQESLVEAATLALRQLHFFQSSHLVGSWFKTRPKFKGCGILANCEGDVLTKDTLFEVKAGDRNFRIPDLRQLLTYSALANEADELTFSKIGLLNPRTGAFWIRDLDVVCRAISGVRSFDVFGKIVETLTETLPSR
jgi:hypothetical protein